MARIVLQKWSGIGSEIREKSVKHQGISKWIFSGNPEFGLLTRTSIAVTSIFKVLVSIL